MVASEMCAILCSHFSTVTARLAGIGANAMAEGSRSDARVNTTEAVTWNCSKFHRQWPRSVPEKRVPALRERLRDFQCPRMHTPNESTVARWHQDAREKSTHYDIVQPQTLTIMPAPIICSTRRYTGVCGPGSETGAIQIHNACLIDELMNIQVIDCSAKMVF